jgi:WD40 repeat protein
MGATLYTPDGLEIVLGNIDGTVTLWSAVTGQLLQSLGKHTILAQAIAVAPSGEHIATGGAGDDVVRVWNRKSRAEEFTLQLQGGGIPVYGLAYSPDGRQIATSSLETKVWNALTGQLRFTLNNNRIQVNSVAFSPDGRRLAVASANGITYQYLTDVRDVMRLAQLRTTRSLTLAERSIYLGEPPPSVTATATPAK